MATTMVRVDQRSHDVLKTLAAQAGVAMPVVLQAAIESYRRQRIVEEANAAYAALRADPVAWAEELEERRAWDTTLMDGMDDE